VLEIFVGPISSATLAFPLAASLTALPFALYHYRRHGRIHPWRAFVSYAFVYYCIAAACLVILPLPELPRGADETAAWIERYRELGAPQFDPTRFVSEIATARTPAWRKLAIAQALFNVALFLPFGAFIAYLFKRKPPVAALWGLGASLLFETSQLTGLFWIYPGPYRRFDAGDLVCNAAGAFLGALLAALLARARALPDLEALPGPDKPWIGPFRRSLAFLIDAAAAALSTLAAFALLDLLGLRSTAAMGAARSALVLFWFVALPVIDGGRGLGRRLLLCAIMRSARKKPARLAILARQGLLWTPPVLVWLAADLLPPEPLSAAIIVAFAVLWLILWSANALRILVSPERAGWLDERLGLRVRNTWRKGRKRRVPRPSAGEARSGGFGKGGRGRRNLP